MSAGARLVRKPLIDVNANGIDNRAVTIDVYAGHAFVRGDPRPACDRCRRRPSDVIVGRDLASGTYLCYQCWGRT